MRPDPREQSRQSGRRNELYDHEQHDYTPSPASSANDVSCILAVSSQAARVLSASANVGASLPAVSGDSMLFKVLPDKTPNRKEGVRVEAA